MMTLLRCLIVKQVGNIEKIIHTKSVRYTIKFTWKEGQSLVNFKVVKIESYEGEEDAPDNVMWYNSEDDTFDKAYETSPTCEGFIKWDGCMEINQMNIHICYWGNQIQEIVDTIYEQGEKIMNVR